MLAEKPTYNVMKKTNNKSTGEKAKKSTSKKADYIVKEQNYTIGKRKCFMYKTTRIEVNNNEQESESLEQQMRRARSNKEPIKATARLTYNDRKDGVLPQHDIRQDRFEIAMMATDKIHATKAAQRMGMDFPETYNADGTMKTPTEPQGEA